MLFCVELKCAEATLDDLKIKKYLNKFTVIDYASVISNEQT